MRSCGPRNIHQHGTRWRQRCLLIPNHTQHARVNQNTCVRGCSAAYFLLGQAAQAPQIPNAAVAVQSPTSYIWCHTWSGMHHMWHHCGPKSLDVEQPKPQHGAGGGGGEGEGAQIIAVIWIATGPDGPQWIELLWNGCCITTQLSRRGTALAASNHCIMQTPT